MTTRFLYDIGYKGCKRAEIGQKCGNHTFSSWQYPEITEGHIAFGIRHIKLIISKKRNGSKRQVLLLLTKKLDEQKSVAWKKNQKTIIGFSGVVI